LGRVLFLSPWIVGMVVFTIIPIFTSLYLSFTNYNMLTPPTWIGLKNYSTIFLKDPRFIKSILTTLKYVLLGVPFKLLFALVIAMILNRKIRFLGFYRAMYYLPSLLGSSVAVSILWRQIFNKAGLLNTVLAKIGITGINWIATPSTAIYTVILLEIWQFGSPMLIFLAGLKQIPVELYESSRIDGAGKFRQFINITIPLLSPTLLFNMIMQMINALQSFNSVFIISGGTGGPRDSTLLISLYLYLKGFTFFQMGYASALAWIVLAIVAFFTIMQFILSKKWVFYEN
jgi:multiple sugar transport system permease protein